jgi:hypothetical protein
MPHLSTGEKVELAGIPVVTGLVAWLAPRPGANLELGELIAGAALLVLLQGFCRDLWLLRQSRLNKTTAAPRAAQCMCVESAMGLTGVVAGIGLVGFGLGHPLFVSTRALVVAVAGVMLAGFLLRDFVFEWSPWKIYREKDHAQVIFRWGK